MPDDYLSLLNPQQRRAVETTKGPVLVLSGAGTGKTRVITERISHILQGGLARPWEILALTFTNKAANEMRGRVSAGSDNFEAVRDIWLGTFHSIGLRILRYNTAAAGLNSNFIVLGEDGQKAVLKTVITALGLETREYPPSDWVEKISAMKDKGIRVIPGLGNAQSPGPGKAGGVEKASDKGTHAVPSPFQIPDNAGNAGVSGMTQKIYTAYSAELARMNAVDFGDLILKVLELFVARPDILQKYQNQFKYIMVDEYQDTNAAQHQLLRMLASGHNNICCVGDDDQSIYSWRGAEIKNILGFEKDYPGAAIIRLETNYRSTGNILGAANSLIRHNRGRLGKDLRCAPNAGDGEKIRIIPLPTDYDEARLIADAIRHETGTVALLIRAGSLSRLFEEEFARRDIGYKLVGATKFYDRMEIKDAVAYVQLLVHPHDDISFARIISKPRRGFGDVAIGKLRASGGGLMSAFRAAQLSGKQAAARDEFFAAFDFNWAGMAPADAAQELLEKSGYIKMWRESKEAEAPERLQNIKALIADVISKYDSLNEFLEHAALMMTEDHDAPETHQSLDNSESQLSTLNSQLSQRECVAIMTIHAAKGLEFDTVFLPAWEDGIFPNEMAIQDGGLEEERRLAYVAITRAKRRAVITNAAVRTLFGQRQYNAPSRFINEIDEVFTCHPGNSAQRNYPGSEKDISKPNQIPGSRAMRAPRNDTMVGKLVTHPELGGGVVIEDAGDILTIAFKDKGIKKVSRKFVNPSC